MATEVVIPKLGMTMKEGTIVQWVAPDGAEVEPEQVLFILATDKLDTDVSAEGRGTLRHGAPAGSAHPVGTVVGWVLADGEAGASSAPTALPARNGRVVATPYARRLAREGGIDLATLTGSGPGGRIVSADVPSRAPESAAPTGSPVLTTPLARRVAELDGIDLRDATGTGPAGRITKNDVAAAGATGTTVPFRGMRKVIADRMHASLQEMAQLTLGMDVDMSEADSMRTQLASELRVSYTDLVGRAAVKALGAHHALNASIDGDVIRLHPSVHLGTAVAVDDGLFVPVVRDADKRDLRSLSSEAARLATACRDRSITVDELGGSTFTITTLGMAGVDFFTPVINPPNVAILGVGRVHDGVGWDGDRPVKRRVMTLSLTIDHRAVDGAPAAAFLAAVRDLLEAPYRLVV